MIKNFVPKWFAATLLGCACGGLAASSVANATTYTVDSVTTYSSLGSGIQVSLTGTILQNIPPPSGCMSKTLQQANLYECSALTFSIPLT
jgi:hypothetical protein